MSLAILDAPPSLHLPRSGGIARDITYAHAVATPRAKLMVRAIETVTGRPGLIRRAAGYEEQVAQGQDFWRVMMQRFGLHLDILHGTLESVPTSGPLVVVANHPYGILDGLVMGHILSGLRGDFRIVANSIFSQAPHVQRAILPISFDETPQAQALNIATRRDAVRYLQDGGAVGIFPGGTVSTAPRAFGQPYDPVWRNFSARMIQKSGATVVPIWFEGRNSRLFQMASHASTTLRLALLVREFRARMDGPVRLCIGAPIGPEALRQFDGDATKMMDFLRARTYEMDPKGKGRAPLGYEFEARHRR
jgi:putative hemolysin